MNILAQADPNSVIQTANTIAGQSDRVLFILALAMLLGGMGYMLKLFISTAGKKDDQLVLLTKESNEASKALAKSVEDLSEHVRESAEIMRGVKAKLNLAVVVFFGCASLLLSFVLFSEPEH